MTDFDLLIERTTSNSYRWQEYPADVLAMTIGDMDFAVPPAVREAIERHMGHGVLGYDRVPARVTDAVVRRLDRLYDWQVDPAWFVYIPGVVPGLNQACRAYVARGGAVLSERPVYYPFLEAPGNMGVNLKTVDALAEGGRWLFDFDGIARLAAEPDTAMLLLCNPQNPLGRVATGEELARLAEICLDNDLVICSDEIHNEVIFKGYRHIPIASLDASVSDRVVTLMSPTKTFGISGLGGAFAIISNAELRARFVEAGKGIVTNVNTFAILAMQAAYSDCDDWLAEMMTYISKNRLMMSDALGNLNGVDFIKPEATYFMWLDFRETGLTDPHAAMLAAGVAFSAGEQFGSQGYLRLNFATPAARLETVLSKVSAVLSV